MSARSDLDDRKLMDWIRPDSGHGDVEAMLATTFELDPAFFETDFLPTFLGLGAWDDTSWANRVAMQRALARTDAAAIMMDARRFQGRPRSLHIEVTPAVGATGSKLHSKVFVVAQERAIRLLVGSANLTASGYRSNREVALPIVATATTPKLAAIVREALEYMPKALQPWWSPAADRVRKTALETMDTWPKPEVGPDRFVWSWGERPLWREFCKTWPDEQVLRLTIVSPFWSDAGEGGPIAQVLERLGHDRIAGAQIRLLTEAAPLTQNSFRPKLPAALAAWDARQLGVNGCIQAVDPRVLPEEVGGRTDYQPTRSLHAKVVLLEGPTTTLAYVGSANFTKHGWGFAGLQSNIEAGVTMLRTGKARRGLDGLVPKSTGEPVELDGKGKTAVTVLEMSDHDPAWPTFVREIRLAPIGKRKERLELRIALLTPDSKEPFSVSLIGADRQTLLESERHATGPIEPQVLETLLRDQRVVVRWGAQSVEFPINVDLEARLQLPVNPGSSAPSEAVLFAYYQGKIAPEDIYPLPPGEVDSGADPDGSKDSVESSVDTSGIQSYQIREFVEALQGMRDDLRAASKGTETAIRHALLGEVSPLALAREACRACKERRRSATAVGFQLVEILVCLADAAEFEVSSKRLPAWRDSLRRAHDEIQLLLSALTETSNGALDSKSAFHRYRAAVLKRIRAA
jgi:hypothetical protein